MNETIPSSRGPSHHARITVWSPGMKRLTKMARLYQALPCKTWRSGDISFEGGTSTVSSERGGIFIDLIQRVGEQAGKRSYQLSESFSPGCSRAFGITSV